MFSEAANRICSGDRSTAVPLRYLLFASIYNSDDTLPPMPGPSGAAVERRYHTLVTSQLTPPSPTQSVFSLAERPAPVPSSNALVSGFGFSQEEREAIMSTALYTALAERSQQNHRSTMLLIRDMACANLTPVQGRKPFESVGRPGRHAEHRATCEAPDEKFSSGIGHGKRCASPRRTIPTLRLKRQLPTRMPLSKPHPTSHPSKRPLVQNPWRWTQRCQCDSSKHLRCRTQVLSHEKHGGRM